MTLLSHADYERIAANLSYPTEAFIGGAFAPALSGETMPTVNPATGKEIARVASCGREDVDKAVAAARKAFESGAWSRMHPSERKKILMRFIGSSKSIRSSWRSSNRWTAGSPSANACSRICRKPSSASNGTPNARTSSTAASPPPETAGWGSSCASPPGWSPASCRGTSRS